LFESGVEHFNHNPYHHISYQLWQGVLFTTKWLAKAKIKNKFVSPYPTDPVKIARLKFFYWKLVVSFFVSLKICFAENSVF
jgi:hypothetical protein